MQPRITSLRVAAALGCGFCVSTSLADTQSPKDLAPISVSGEELESYVAQQSTLGTKTSTPLRETPMSISVVTREQLQDLQVQDIAESVRYVAGAIGGEDGRDGFGAIRLRGFAQGSSTLRDGTRQNPFNIIPQDPYGLERVEVLKGPASVLYGQSGPGGMLNLVSKLPTRQAIREVNASLGSFDYRQLSADFSDSIDDEGTWSYRLVARGLDRDDAVDFADERRVYVAPSVSWRPSAATTLTLLADFVDIEAVRINTIPIQGVITANPNGTLPLTRFIGEPDFDLDDKRQYQVGYQFQHALNERWTLRQHTRFTQYDADTQTTFSTGIQNNLRLLNRNPVTRDYDGTVFTTDTHAQALWSTGNWAHTSLLGVDYLRYNEEQVRYNGTVAPLDLFNPVYGRPVTRNATAAIDNERNLRQVGFYAQNQAKYDDRWVFLLGGRYDQARDVTDNFLNGTATKIDDNAFTARLGAVYLAANGLSPYVSFSQAFQPISGADAAGNPFDPETGEQIEVGVKYEPAGSRWGATLAFYDLRRKDVPTPDPDDASNRIQVGEQTHRGVELEVVGEVFAGFSVITALSYMDAEITKDNTLDVNGNKRLEGKKPTRIPERMASVWGKYRLPGAWLRGVSIGVGSRYVAGVQANAANTFEVPSYGVWDAALYFQRDRYSISLNAKNLFDRDYFASGTSDANVVVGDPRMLIGNFSYRW